MDNEIGAHRRVMLRGVGVYPFTDADELIDFADRRKGILVAINAEKILNAKPRLTDIVNSNIGYCDGFGAVMALKKKGYKEVIKIPGCELWLRIIHMTYQQGKSYYLIGGKQEVIEQTVKKLKEDYPGIWIVNFRNGYIKTEEERNALLDDIVTKRPDVVFVAMGSPKQELLMEEMAERHTAVYQGLGGSSDVYTGNVKRAPQWWIRHNLEGLYRPLASFTWPKMRRLFKAMPFWWNVLTNKY